MFSRARQSAIRRGGPAGRTGWLLSAGHSLAGHEWREVKKHAAETRASTGVGFPQGSGRSCASSPR